MNKKEEDRINFLTEWISEYKHKIRHWKEEIKENEEEIRGCEEEIATLDPKRGKRDET